MADYIGAAFVKLFKDFRCAKIPRTISHYSPGTEPSGAPIELLFQRLTEKQCTVSAVSDKSRLVNPNLQHT